MLTASGNKAARADRNKVCVVRHDDFVVTKASPEVAEEAKALITPFLAERGLKLSAEKTHVDAGFVFLDWDFRTYGGKLIIKQSKRAIKAFAAGTHRSYLAQGRGLARKSGWTPSPPRYGDSRPTTGIPAAPRRSRWRPK